MQIFCTLECTLFQFECLCGDKRCIRVEEWDDGVKDCADGSDELKAEDLAAKNANFTCSDGSTARNASSSAPNPPPGPPMVPCGPNDLNLCSEELGEMCLVRKKN